MWMASSLRGYLRRLRLFNLAAPIVVDAVRRLGAMDHGCAPCLSQPSASSTCLLVRSKLCGLLLEPNRQPVAFRPVLDPVRPIDQRSGDSLQRAIMDFEQPIGDANSVIRVDADQVGVEGHVVDFGQRQAMRDHPLF
jgi:hypothetical protein